jgi:hypothetical protein
LRKVKTLTVEATSQQKNGKNMFKGCNKHCKFHSFLYIHFMILAACLENYRNIYNKMEAMTEIVTTQRK